MAVDNIEIAKQLKKLQEELNDLVDTQTKALKSQLDITKQIAESLGQMTNNSEETVNHLQKTQDTLEKAAENAGKLGAKGTTARFAEALKKSNKEGKGLSQSLRETAKILPGMAAFTGMWDGFTAGISGTVNALRLFSSTALSALEGLGQLALAVITFPFRILSILTDFASKGGGDNSLRQELENIRKEFGDLRKSSAKAIIDISRGMKGELANTGLSVYRTFGRLAERLKTIAEYAKNMGNVFAMVAGQFVKNGEVVAAYIKGLHLTEEGQKALGDRSYALGISMAELSRQIANYSVQLADEFGLSAAEVSRDMGDMMADFEHFGSLAPQVLAQVSVYARRLGVDVKGLLGVIDQFDNFEGAATSAAQLTQAFGLQLDALQLLKAEDPAERTEMIRKSFFAAGRSIEHMARAERNLLAAQTGLDENNLNLIFSTKNQGLSYDQVKKKSEGARKSQLTQAESLQKIAGAIERIVRSGSMGGGGFFERFFQGFERGLTWSREFREVMVNIRIALRETYRAGIDVGRAFVDMFPGVRQLLKGIAELFNRNRFREMTKNLKAVFREFFDSLTSTTGRDSFRNLMERLKTMFWNYFDGSSSAGRGILDGVRKFSKAAAVIFAGMIREAARGITQGIRFISDLLSGRKTLAGVTAGGEGALGFIMELLDPIIEAIKEAWPPLVEALEQLWTEEIWPRVSDFLVDHAALIATILFGPALLRSIAGGIAGAFAGAFTKGLTQGAMAAVGEFASSGSVRASLSKGISSVFSRGAGGVTAAVTEAGATATATVASPAANPAANASALRVAGFIAVGMAALVLGIWAIAEIMKQRDLSPAQMLSAAAVMIAAGVVMLELSGVATAIAGVGEILKAAQTGFIVGMVAVSLMAAAMGIGIVGMVHALSGFTPGQLATTALAMAAGGAFFLAVAAVLAIATTVGLGLLTGVGLVGALAGFAAMSLATAAMVGEIQNVVAAVNELNIPEDFDRRFEVFTGVLGAITSFGDYVARISESSSSSSLWSWITGSGPEDQVRVLEQLSETISEMGTVMTRLVSNILAQVSNLSAAPDQLKRVELFGTIMTTLSSMMTALQAPSELFNTGGILASIIGSDIAGNLSNYSIFIENMGISLTNILTQVATVFTGPLANVTFAEGAAKSFETIGHILEILGALGRSMITTITNNFSHLKGDEFTARIAEVSSAVGTLLSGIFSGGGGGLIETISELMTRLVGAMSGISERDASRLATLGPVLVSMFEAIAQIGLTVSDLSSLATSIPAEARGEALGTINALVQNMLGGVGEIVESLLTSVREVFAGMSRSEASSLKTGVEAFKSMIDVVVSLPPALKTLYETLSEGSTTDEYGTMMARLGTIISLFYERGAGEASLPELFRVVAAMFNTLPAITGDPATKFDQLSKGLGSLREISSIPFADIITGIEANTASLRDGAFQQLHTNINAMIESVNCIATDLGTINDIEINSSLKALAGRMGLGDSAELTITNRNFNVNVTVDVHIDATELERVLTTRPNSTIMTR